MATPVKNPRLSHSQISETCRSSENSDPNLPISTPSKKPIKSPLIKPASTTKPATQIPRRLLSPPPPPRERKFIVAKKNSKRGAKDPDVDRCRQTAYEALRASQEDFFRKDHAVGSPLGVDPSPGAGDGPECGKEQDPPAGTTETVDRSEGSGCLAKGDSGDLEGSSEVKRRGSSKVVDETLPEPGSGRVKDLVKAFESLLSVSKYQEVETVEENKPRVINWDFLDLQHPAKETEVSSLYGCSSAELFPSLEFKGSSKVDSSMDGNGDRLSWGSGTSGGSRRSRRNSTDSCGRSWNKKLKVTSQKPFKLRTEQRGRLKEEHFLKKVKEMLMEEEEKRIPIAQGLPWTTDEPEVLVKPLIKESTEPIDPVLHSDVRAVKRAEFDHYVSERLSLAEQMKLERERQQKLEEEEEIWRLRRELVPRAQPMPYFDQPFVPKKSTRPRTIPKEPRFHTRPIKSSCISTTRHCEGDEGGTML